MAISLYRGPAHIEWYPKAASVAFAVNEAVYLDSSGYVAKLTSTADKALGLVQEKTASTDSDYAENTLIPVLIPGVDTEFLIDVGTGTAATTDIGEHCDADGSYPATKIDVTASTYDIWLVTKIISTTQVVAKMTKKSGAAAA